MTTADMPKIVVQTSAGATLATLTERLDATNLLDKHYATQLVERLHWAAADAEALELAPPAADSAGRGVPA